MEPDKLAIQHLEDGKNILLTGGAGVGKSYNLRKILEWADEKDLNVARTALTGMASLQFDMGETLHRCMGIGLAKNKDDLKRVTSSYKFKQEKLWELRALDLLIIDEISMLRSDTLELVDALLKYVFGSDKPFGGLQTILSGDFMQLSPIVKPEEKPDFKKRGYWAFQSPVWNELDLKIIYLKEVKRQDDPNFANALNMLRAGAINPTVSSYFSETSSHEFPKDVEPVRLLSTNKEVNSMNNMHLKKLKTPLEVYEATVRGKDDKLKAQIIRDCPGMERLELKKGAQVMILVNDKNRQFVNGSMGEFVEVVERRMAVSIFETKLVKCAVVRLFESDEIVEIPEQEWKIEKRKGDKVTTLARMVQLPIKLGWAITIHKSQGMSLDYLNVDLKRCFAEGMAYVALSRARNYDGLSITGWNPGSIKCNKDAFNFYMGLKNEGKI